MSPAFTRVAISIISFALATATMVVDSVDRRIVDAVEVGDEYSEANHGYVGAEATNGTLGDKTFRQARGFMRYAMKTFDDTPLTVACTFISTDSATFSYDLVVEDSLIATRTVITSRSAPTVQETAVPFEVTKGRTNVAIIIRARGGVTPKLHALRTVQDHNEWQWH